MKFLKGVKDQTVVLVLWVLLILLRLNLRRIRYENKRLESRLNRLKKERDRYLRGDKRA